MNQAEKLKDTLNLPKTDFPMRANAVEREPVRIDHWKDLKIYARMQEKNKSGKSFVLHDGPPFTNGGVHVGTALNKILKDTILRFKSACGFRTPYVPGWDCHGLPIEHKVTKALRKEKKDFDSLVLRQGMQRFFQFLYRDPAQTIPTAWGSCRLGKRISYHERSLRGGDSQDLRVLR